MKWLHPKYDATKKEKECYLPLCSMYKHMESPQLIHNKSKNVNKLQKPHEVFTLWRNVWKCLETIDLSEKIWIRFSKARIQSTIGFFDTKNTCKDSLEVTIQRKNDTFGVEGSFSKLCPWKAPLALKVPKNIHKKHHFGFHLETAYIFLALICMGSFFLIFQIE
jgi:hypothetical protein